MSTGVQPAKTDITARGAWVPRAVRIGLGGDRGHKQRAVVVCGLDRVDEEGEELDVVLRGFARGQ